jgi:hypothetical protein
VTTIPRILHYTFGLAQDFGGKPWSLVHHVCLRSAVERLKPERVHFYYEFEPTGPWWELSRELVTPIKIEAPREIFGRPLSHVAHRADVVRLQKLIEHGGIYLDADVLVQRSFDDLLQHSTILGQEGVEATWGTANAVILAEKAAPFLVRWLDAYQSFRGVGREAYWNEHSVQLPSKLARAHPDEITILPHSAFFWPLWTDDHLKWMFRSTKPIPLEGVYANHLWEAQAWRYLEDLTPGRVRALDTNFHIWARPFVSDLPDSYGAPSPSVRVRKAANRALDDGKTLAKALRRQASRAKAAAKRLVQSEGARRRQTFQDVYKRNQWGSEPNSTFYSGVGSRGEAAATYAERMAEILARHAEELGRPLTIVDIGCGDFKVGRALLDRLPGSTYIGCDIVPELIAYNNSQHAGDRVSFRRLDIVTASPPPGDVCLVRQVLQHLSNAEIAQAVRRLDYSYVYVTEGHPRDRSGPLNPDKAVGADVRFDWRTGVGRGVELDQPPYGLMTQEVFRAPAPPHEIIITERVFTQTRPAVSSGSSQAAEVAS